MEKFLGLLAIVVTCFGVIASGLDLSKIDTNDIASLQPNANEALEKAKTLVKDKCIKVAGEEAGTKAYNEIESGVMQLGECAMSIVNVTAIQKEIEDASPKGELDTVFSKYCNKRPEAFKCIDDFNAKVAPCLEQKEKESQAVLMGIVHGILNFVCHKDGDQIALFIAEKGPECFASKREEMQECFESTFAHYVPKEGMENIKTLPLLVMEDQQCDDMQRLETCIVEKLEKCEETTPANLVESMFRFIKKETKCAKKQ